MLGIATPSDRQRLPRASNQRGCVEIFVPDLDHPHSRLKKRLHKPRKCRRIRPPIHQHAEIDSSQTVGRAGRADCRAFDGVKPVSQILEPRCKTWS